MRKGFAPIVILLLVVVLAAAGIWYLKNRSEIDIPGLLGQSVYATNFLYNGKAIHPSCLDGFLQNNKSTVDLRACNPGSTNIKSRDGWILADRSTGYTKYRVLWNEGERYLIATSWTNSGSAIFSNLVRLREGSNTLHFVESIASGDRCNGGLSNYRIEGSILHFSQSLTASGLMDIAATNTGNMRSGDLESGATFCFGTANYEYNLATNSKVLTSTNFKNLISVASPERMNQSPLQLCFNEIYTTYTKNGNATLTPQELAAFGRQFTTQCKK